MTFADLVPLLFILVATGLFAGVIAGLLGVGGGIVTVPVLEYLLRFADVPPEARMHVAVATSLAAVIPTAIASARAHHARGAVDWSLARAWAVPLFAGGLTGSLIAAHADTAVLTAVFGVVAAIVALKMALPLEHVRLAAAVPRRFGGGLLAGSIGIVSAMMGIGGGTIAVPAMTLTGEAIHRAVGTAAFFGFIIGLPGTIGYLLARPEVELPWGTVGLVSVPGVAILAPATVLTAPVGAWIAHGLDRRKLSIAFGAFLLVVAARMVWRTLNAGAV